jgi:hypothetical protein
MHIPRDVHETPEGNDADVSTGRELATVRDCDGAEPVRFFENQQFVVGLESVETMGKGRPIQLSWSGPDAPVQTLDETTVVLNGGFRCAHGVSGPGGSTRNHGVRQLRDVLGSEFTQNL